MDAAGDLFGGALYSNEFSGGSGGAIFEDVKNGNGRLWRA
jgi:hypothetical protein